MAAFLAHPEIVQLLLASGASPDAKNGKGETPLGNLSAPWSEELAGVYNFIGNLIGEELDLERIRGTRPEVLKLLKEHVAESPKPRTVDGIDSDAASEARELLHGAIEAGKVRGRGNTAQASIVPVGPAVVAALDHRPTLAAPIQESRPAVSANVEKCPQDAISAAHHDRAVSPEIQRDEVSRLQKFIFVSDELPASKEEERVFEFQEFFVRVDPTRQGLSASRRGGVLGDFVFSTSHFGLSNPGSRGSTSERYGKRVRAA